MSFKKTTATGITVLDRAIETVPGFSTSYEVFKVKNTIRQSSKSMLHNYSRSIATIALHFGRSPELITAQEINSYLYSLASHQSQSLSYFKHAVYGMRHWYRLFELDEFALKLPAIKKKQILPTVLSKEECKELFKAPTNHKHRFLLAFAYSSGLRLKELRVLRISDVDIDRMQIHVRNGKGGKDRYVILSKYIAQKLKDYLDKYKPIVYLFEGLLSGNSMGERSVQYVINEAKRKTMIRKEVSMHTLRHSYATHLLEDGLDVFSIQRLLGHADIRSTMVYLHVARINPTKGHSPLDTLYNIK